MSGLSSEKLPRRLRELFTWQGDRTDDASLADMTGWWRDGQVLAALGPALAALVAEERPTVVLGIESRGSLLGALVAVQLGVGLLEVRKNRSPSADSDAWVQATTPPDYRDRHLRLRVRARHLQAGERVLAVDDWVETGGQMTGAKQLVERAGATWTGLAVVVDGSIRGDVRRRLQVRSLLHVRDL